jgi:hypothetical protein
VVEQLVRLGWADVFPAQDASRVVLTQCGRAVLRSLEDEATEADRTITVVLGSKDPIAYPQLISSIQALGTALVADPYMEATTLHHLVLHTKVNRVLLSTAQVEPKRSEIEPGLPALAAIRPIEVRVVKNRAEFHDRFGIPDGTGPVYSVGSSFNAVGKSALTTWVNHEDADVIRKRYEALWSAAEVTTSTPPRLPAPPASLPSSPPPTLPADSA